MAESLSDLQLLLEQSSRDLLASEARFRNIIERTVDGVLIVDRQGLVRFVNPAAQSLFGRPAAEMLGGMLGFPVVAGETTELDIVRTSAGAVVAEVRVVETEWEGETAYLASLRDVTEREQAFKELARRASEMELLHRVSKAAMVRLDHESMLRLVLNEIIQSGFACGGGAYLCEPGLETGTAIDRMELRAGLPPGYSSPPTEASQYLQLAASPLAAAAVRDRHAVAGPGADAPASQPEALIQEPAVEQVAAVPLLAGESIVGLLSLTRKERRPFTPEDLRLLDLVGTEVGVAVHNLQLYDGLQQANRELRQVQEMMFQEERLRALGQMASGIAHDINNALSPILGFAELLLHEGEWEPKTKRHLEMIATSARDIAVVVDRLREFYRGRDKQDPLRPVDLVRVAADAVELTRPRWRDMPQEQGLVIQVRDELPEELPPVLGVEAELRQALANLLLNAVDAMPQGGELTVRGYAQEPWVVLEVTDTGTGMTDEVRRRCLEPFFTSKGERGTGMGLSVVFGVINRHEGEIDIRTALGHGTTFVLRLPAAKNGFLEEECQPIRVRPARLLCVDDEPLLREFLQDALTQFGHTVTVADGGQAGMAAFAAGQFDAVITDLGMPEVDGRTVALGVKARSPETPVILLTGWGTRLRVEGDIPEGVDLVLAKPTTSRQLQMALAEVLTAKTGAAK